MRSAETPGYIYTFYSYKGGVGRSMAVANVGALLVKWGARVLVVDWDLEAPGLEVFFQQAGVLKHGRESRPGVVDLLVAREKSVDLPWRKCVLQAEVFGRPLDIISAGRKTELYEVTVQGLDWRKLFEEHRIGNYLNGLRNEWKAEYDFVLIDSRTGITDIGDICTVLLPDALVLLLISNHQNLQGIQDVMERAKAAHAKLPVDRGNLVGVPVLARDEVYTEYDKSQEWKLRVADELGDLYRTWLPRSVEPTSAINKLFIPYVTNWSFGERLPVVERESEIDQPTSISAAYARLAKLLESGLDWSAVEGKVERHEVSEVRFAKEEAERTAARANRVARLALAGAATLLIVFLGYVTVQSEFEIEPAIDALFRWVLVPSAVVVGMVLAWNVGPKLLGRARPWFFREETSAHGDLTHYQALALSTAGTVSSTTVISTVSAVMIGGPGVLVWMFLTGLVMLFVTFGSVYVTLRYRTTDVRGRQLGTPVSSLENVSERPWLHALSPAYSFLMAIAGLTLTSLITQMDLAVDGLFSGGNPTAWTVEGSEKTLFVIVFLVIAPVLGGLAWIRRITAVMVPTMVLFFLWVCSSVLVNSADQVFPALYRIAISALTPQAVLMGAGSAGLIELVRQGVVRGVGSSGSATGTAAILASGARTAEPARHATIATLQTYVGTFVVSGITGLVMVAVVDTSGPLSWSDTWHFLELAGFGGPVLAAILVAFSYTSLLTWSYVGERSATHLLGSRASIPYRCLFLVMALLLVSLQNWPIWSKAVGLVGDLVFAGAWGIHILALFYLRSEIGQGFRDFHQRLRVNRREGKGAHPETT